MSKSKMSMFKDKHAILVIITVIIFAIMTVGIGFACIKYYQQVQYTVRDESTEYMTEISNQMTTNAGKNFQDNFAVLGTIASLVEKSNGLDNDVWKSIASTQQEYWKFNSIMLITESGAAIDGNGKNIVLFNDTFLREAIIDRKPSMSASQNIDGKESIIFIRPIDDIVLNGVKIFALATSYELATFDNMLSVTAFQGKCYSHIIKNDGVVVIRSSSQYASDSGYNLLNSIEDAKFNDGKTIEGIKSDIARGVSGLTEFSIDDQKEYMIYSPLKMSEWVLVSFVPVSVVNYKSEVLLNTTLLLSSVIAIVFILLIVVLMIDFFYNKRKLERIAYVDSITGGHTIQKFYELAQGMFNTYPKGKFALVYLNIEKFKILNEQYGRVSCDNILRCITAGIGSDLSQEECIGRLVADNFGVLVRYEDIPTLLSRFDSWYNNCENSSIKSDSNWLPLVIDFGIYVIEDTSLDFAKMIDRAKLALTKSSHEIRGKIRYAIYDEQVRKRLFREKNLEDIMEKSLENNEFKVYLQPKYNSNDEKIGGAEALVRWQKPEGMIYPDEFIPLFEKNGFIVHVDLFVFESVCKKIREWIDLGISPMKISVNCSRVHLKDANFFTKYCEIAQKYNVPTSLIEIELTESMMFEDIDKVKTIIKGIHDAGFSCSMDDFGSGYSSFNLIQEIPVDTIKLDKIFFLKGKDIERTESVISGIISMSKALSMQIVAEGVEERLHVDMLKRLNCDLIQGYFFAKPMPICDFEKLAFNSGVVSCFN